MPATSIYENNCNLLPSSQNISWHSFTPFHPFRHPIILFNCGNKKPSDRKDCSFATNCTRQGERSCFIFALNVHHLANDVWDTLIHTASDWKLHSGLTCCLIQATKCVVLSWMRHLTPSAVFFRCNGKSKEAVIHYWILRCLFPIVLQSYILGCFPQIIVLYSIFLQRIIECVTFFFWYHCRVEKKLSFVAAEGKNN